MRSLAEIKRLEREALKNYIRELVLSLPVVVLTDVDKVLARAIWEKIENAKNEHALI